MHANLCYQYSCKSIHHSNEYSSHGNSQHQETREKSSNPFQHQAEVDNETENDDNVDPDNIRKCLYITATLTVILLLSTTVAVALSLLTYTQLTNSSMHEVTQVFRQLTRIRNDTNSLHTQATEIQEVVSLAFVHLTSTKKAVAALQAKFDREKLNLFQASLNLEKDLMQPQAENLQVQLYCGAGEWHA